MGKRGRSVRGLEIDNLSKEKVFITYALLDTRKKGKFIYDTDHGKIKFDYEPYYIGKGKGEKRPHYHFYPYRMRAVSHKNNKSKKIIKETGSRPKIEIINKGLDEYTSYMQEINFISIIGRHEDGTGPLTNLALGGDGGRGVRGFLHANSIPVYKYCPNGIFIDEFGSMNIASESYGGSRDNIRSCVNGERSLAHNFIWKDYKVDRVESTKSGLFFIPGNVPSSKNSRVWTGKFNVVSKTVKKYILESKTYWEDNRSFFVNQTSNIEKPYKIGIHFIRDSKRKYDWVNPVQTVQDLMVKYGWVEDDSVNDILPYPMNIYKGYTTIDRISPGVFIRIIKYKIK